MNADTNKERKARFFFGDHEFDYKEVGNVVQNLNEEFIGSIYDIKLEDFNLEHKV